MYAELMATKLGEIVLRYRKQRKLTQKQLGELVGISHTYIYNIEKGKNDIPKPEVMARLSQALGVPELDLVQAVGYLQGLLPNGLAREDVETEIRRIRDLPTFEAKIDRLTQLSPEMYGLVNEMARGLLDRAAQQPGQSSPPAPIGQRPDQLHE